MGIFHSVLDEQIKKYLDNNYLIDEKLRGLLLEISKTYEKISDREEKEVSEQSLLQKLQFNEARYRQIVECTTDLIYGCDAEGYLIYANPVACQRFGYTEEEIRQLHFTDVVALEHREMVRDFYKRQFEERIIDTYLEFKCLTRDGKTAWIGNNVHLQLNAEHNWVVGFQGVARDMTEAKQAEETLIQARRMAEESVKAKEHFLSVMSHEIRTPLNAVIGLSHLLLDENPLPNQVEHLQAIKHSADSLMIIINDILDFSKIESGKVSFENVDFKLDDIFRGIEKSLAYKARESNLRLLIETDPRLPATVVGDPLRLNQIILNLVSNAIKFTEKGFVEVKAQMVSQKKDTITIEFKITDTGIGIPANKLSTIFESFTQASHETTRKYGGTGLGLTITKRLVELKGGTIQVKSKIGLGSTFTVLLTFEKSHLTAPVIPVPSGNTIEASTESLDNLQVLLVEDNRMNQLVVKKFMEKWGVRMDIAENGIEAIEKLRESTFSLVLMDLQMPQMDGYKAARYIRYNMDYPYRNIPIVALTASAMVDVRRKVMDAGMNDFITKPFDPRDLYLKILKFSMKGSQSDESPIFTPSVLPGNNGYVNLQYLEEISANNQEFITDMIRLFLRQMPQFVQKLKKACENANWMDLRYITHKMKSSLSTIGIFELESVIRQLETYAAQESHLIEVVQLCNHVERVCEEVYTELKEKLNEKNLKLIK
ncbi:PAS domain-containing hybrid sensor histidine kinase/response regulator [Xanthocytophaga flava]|uniref:PAS domain-containing hybrid sensor histidine kinase/response regulator n=1 Tax=Xanthocytophaga flava TaxID=3048013 RepID=UPI0028D0FFFF|nr:ATP-binding protein [Xanthocytophaga flavus]MDJ1468019.1 ATP-binding protein [Xanthocytophaga flavus]